MNGHQSYWVVMLSFIVQPQLNFGVNGKKFDKQIVQATKFVFYIREKDLGEIKLNDTVEVKVDSHPEKVFRGVITYISPEAEFTPKNVQTKDERVKLVYAVKVKVKNPERILKAGMLADVEIKMK